jgi:hypothetical protein
MECVVRELEVEERRLCFLVLRCSGKDVVGQSRGFGHRDVDHHHQLQGAERLAARSGIRQGMSGVAAFDDHRAESVRVIAQNFLGYDVARDQSADDRGAGNRCPADVGGVPEQRPE